MPNFHKELKMKKSRLHIYGIISEDKKEYRKIPVYGGKNKTSLLTEKKPAYDRIKNYGQ